MANGFVDLPDPIEDTHRGSLLVSCNARVIDGRAEYLFPPSSIPSSEARSQPFNNQSNFPIHPYPLRTQRSTSSLSGWSTVTSDTNTASDFDDDDSSMSTFPASHSPQSGLAGPHNQSRQYSPQSLSIDPKLFAPMEMDGETDEEMLVTAKPKELVGTLDPTIVLESLKKEKADNCTRKVSHARKVCPFPCVERGQGINPSIANCRPYS